MPFPAPAAGLMQRSGRLRAWLALCSLLALLAGLLLPAPARAAITLVSSSTGRTDNFSLFLGLSGSLSIARPANVRSGMVMVATIATRPAGMSVTVPSGWVAVAVTDQYNGGSLLTSSGMTLQTYYKVATSSEPTSYTWSFYSLLGLSGSTVGGILAFSGVDTLGVSPIDRSGAAWSARLNGYGTTQGTNAIQTATPQTMIVSSLAYLSASSFNAPAGISGLVENIDQSTPTSPSATGLTLQMATALFAGTGWVGGTSATANGGADYGAGHLLALKASGIDPRLTMTRNAVPVPGSNLSYALVVDNAGTQSEPGPLTVVDTLPANVTYVGYSGTGWSCSRVGQVVTCTRSGTLAAGASAPTLTLNVTVNGTATGALTNTATVTGTGNDGNLENNTDADSYAIPTAPWAWWELDEASWGVVADASGNAHLGTGLGAAAPTGSGLASPPGPAIAGNPGSCGAARIPAATTATGINTAVAINTVGNSGTLAFWYAGNGDWNDGNARMLFDASMDLPTGDRHFFLAKDADGKLVFSLKDGLGTTATVTSPTYGHPAGEWHHITATWSLSSGTLALYVDGTLAASSTTALSGLLGTLSTLYIGSQRMAGISGTPAAYTANSANGYIDEVRLYSSALSALEIEGIPAYTHTCAASIHHYELSLPSSAVSCLASSVTVAACADASSPCTNRSTSAANHTVTLLPAGAALGATTLSFDATGTTTTTMSNAAALDGATATVTLLSAELLASAAAQCCPNGSSCTASPSCSTTYKTAGLVIAAANGGAATTVGTQTAGSAASYVLRAVKTNTSTQACEAALTGSTGIDWAYQCNNPATCSAGNRLTVTGSSAVAVAGNAAATWLSSTTVPMSFDANGNAPFSIAYADVGQITLGASKAAGGALLTALSGRSNAFVVRPAGFTVSGVRCTLYASGACATGTLASPGNNPGATDATGAAFMPAGKAFTATATAVDATGNATPNYGRELLPESVKLTANLVQPAGGTAPALQNGSVFGPFSSGVASASTLVWPEVGVITLTPSVADGDYLGTGNVTGAASGPVGRFTPHHFDLTATPACGALFSYAGQPFTVTLTARNGLAVPTATTNYAWSATAAASFARSVGFSESVALGLGTFSSGGVAASGFAAGVGSGTASYAFTTKTTPPSLVTVRATDADGISSAGGLEPAMLLRSGRLRLSNAFGSARSALQVPLSLDYWSGQAWVVAADDSCTTLAPGNVVISNPRNAQGAASTAATTASALTLVAGRGLLTLSAPTPAGSTLTVDLALNLGSSGTDQSCQASHPASTGAAQPWLRSQNGGCAASADRDPAGRASFGVYSPESRRSVHIRDVF